MSDGEPSSIKQFTRCATRVPALSSRYEDRVEERFDFAVYGSRFAAHYNFSELYKKRGEKYASGSIQKMETQDIR